MNRAFTLGLLIAFVVTSAAVVAWGVLWRRYSSAGPLPCTPRVFAILPGYDPRPALDGIRPRNLGPRHIRDTPSTTTERFANQAHNDWGNGRLKVACRSSCSCSRSPQPASGPALHSLWGIGVTVVFIHSFVDYPREQPALAGFFLVFRELWSRPVNRRCQNNHKKFGWARV